MYSLHYLQLLALPQTLSVEISVDTLNCRALRRNLVARPPRRERRSGYSQ